ncbi:hypothetical protein M422DRAFT_247796 [Sphaerobolus stellatus SS14]|nr:hypothetical protein M422DRAFT_247796 [Sphaerobolus stellatus SS14]
MYVIDVIDPNERTVSLSKLTGWGLLGISPSFLLGRFLSPYFKDVSLVLSTSAGCMAIAFVYVLFLIPESFPKSKRDLIKRQREEELSLRCQNPLMKLLSNLLIPFESLRLLKPIHNASTGRKSYRLVWCGLHAFIVGFGEVSADFIVIFYLFTKFSLAEVGLLDRLRPDEFDYGTHFGLALCRTNRSMAFDTILYQTRSRSVRKFISFKHQRRIHRKIYTALDVHITFGPWVIGAVALVLVGLSKTKTGMYRSLLLWAFCAGRMPVFTSLIAYSVEPALQAEALSAVYALLSAGGLLSLFLGSVLTWFNSFSHPFVTVFLIHGAIVIVGASFLFLIRDEDRIIGIVEAEAETTRSPQD